MNFQKVLSLSEKIDKKDYSKYAKSDSLMWNGISVLMQLINTILSFLGIYILVHPIIAKENQYVIYAIGFILFLFVIGWEILKRKSISKMVYEYYYDNKINTSVISNAGLLLIILSFSAFLAVNGSKEFANTEKQENIIIDSYYITQIDSVKRYYNTKIESVEKAKNLYIAAIESQNRTLKPSESKQIEYWDSNIKDIKQELKSAIETLQSEQNNKKSKQQASTQSNISIFIFITLVIETFIIIGVYRFSLYNIKSYKEISKSEEYKRYVVYLQLLDIIYKKGKLTQGDVVTSKSYLYRLAAQKKSFTNKDIDSFFDLLQHLAIISEDKRNKTFLMNYSQALDLLNENN